MADEKDSPPSGGMFSRLGKGLKSLVVEETTVDGTPAAAPIAPTAPKAVVSGGGGRPPVATAPTTGATRPRFGQISVDDIDPGIRAKIEGVVAQAAMPAFTAFEKMEAGMRSVIPDERTRMAATLSALTTQSVAPAAIITDLDECLAALDKRQVDAERSAQAAIDKRVGEKQKRIADCEAQISAKHAEITALQNQIDDLENERDACRTEVETARAEIQELSRQFAEAIGAFRALYESKKQRLQGLINTGGSK